MKAQQRTTIQIMKRKYLYIAADGLRNQSPAEQHEFEGPLHVILAREEGEKRGGPGGRLFMEIPESPPPVATIATNCAVT